MKGYLISKTGILQEGHSLIKLCKKAMEFKEDFKAFLKECAFVNVYYIETRCPSEDPMNINEEVVEMCLDITKSIIQLVDNLVAVV